MSNDYTKIAKQIKTYGHAQGLMKYINYESLLEQHKKQTKGKATGVDGIDKTEYEKEWIVNPFLDNFYKDTFLYSIGVK